MRNSRSMLVAFLATAYAAFAAAGATQESVAATAARGAGTWYRCAEGHFRFVLPHYWTILPDEKVKQFKAKLRKSLPSRPVPDYILAFQRKALLSFTFPYALVEVQNGPMPTPADVEAERAGFAANVRSAYKDLHDKRMFGEVKAMPATYDTNAHVVVGFSQMTRAHDSRKISAVTAIYPCRYGYMRIHFFLPAEKEVTYLTPVETVITSVTFEAGYGYVPRSGRQGTFKHMRYLLPAGVVVMGVIWIGMRMYARCMPTSGR